MGIIKFYFYLFLLLIAIPAFALPSARERVGECQAFYREIKEPLEVRDAENGPIVRLPAISGNRRFEQMTELRLMTRNTLNLETRDEAYRRAIASGMPEREARDLMAKPDWARAWLAREVQQNRPDVLLMQEVHGFHSLRDFAQQDLRGQYRPLLIHGNDSRIDIGILVRRDLPLDLEVFSQANRMAPAGAEGVANGALYHRDTPVLLLRRAGASEAEQPLVGLIGVHLKSQRDSPGDPGGLRQRTREALGILETQRQFERRFPNVPMLVMGDFNNDVRRAPEFSALRQNWINTMDLAPNPMPVNERATHFYFERQVPPQYEGLPRERVPREVVTYRPSPSQLDGSYLTQPIGERELIRDSRIIPYRDERGQLIPNPQTPRERSNFPSDHRGLMTILDILSLRRIQGETVPAVPAAALH